jgi:glycerol uptake facilitator-like aquaporin
MEAIGTFFLVLVFGFTGDPFAIGFTLMALVYMGSPISGAHYNPAVSVAFFLKRKLRVFDLIGYLSAQLLGGFLAAIVIYFLANAVFYVEPPATSNLYQQAFGEVAFTFIFVIVMLLFSLSASPRRSQLKGLIVGLTFTSMLMVSTSISGGVLNPAISWGTAGLDYILGGNSYLNVLLYTLAPVAGGALAAFFLHFMHADLEG